MDGDGQHALYRLDEDPTEASDLAAVEPERARRMLEAHSAHPRGRTIHLPLYKGFLWDPDLFGGKEGREPWADVVVD